MEGQKRLLLLVEDSRPSAKALCRLLSMHNFSCTPVETIADALEALKKEPPFGVVILDLMLPDGEGKIVLAHIRQVSYPAKVIITSGTGDPQRIAEINELKPEVYIKKPISIDVLIAALS